MQKENIFVMEKDGLESKSKLDLKLVRLAQSHYNGEKVAASLFGESSLEDYVETRLEKLRLSLYKLEEKLNEENEKYVEKEEKGVNGGELIDKDQYKNICKIANITI